MTWRTQLARYAIVGVANTGAGFGMYAFVLLLHGGLVLALVAAQISGMLNSLIMNKRWTFGSSRRSGLEIIRFTMVYAFTFVINLAMLRVMVGTLGWGRYEAQMVALPIMMCAGYVGHRTWTFAQR